MEELFPGSSNIKQVLSAIRYQCLDKTCSSRRQQCLTGAASEAFAK